MKFGTHVIRILLLAFMAAAAAQADSKLEPPAAQDRQPPTTAEPAPPASAKESKPPPSLPGVQLSAMKPGDYAMSMNVADVKRTVFLHVPPAYVPGKSLPLVILLHGQGGSATGVFTYTAMGLKADKGGFILACPAAKGEPPAWAVGFNSGMQDNSDILFLGALIDRLVARLGVDPERVFVAGHSSGGMMAYRLASEISDKIAAIGVVAGTIGAWNPEGQLTMIHRPARPVSVIAFHGTDDPTNPYSSDDKWVYNHNFVPAVECAAYWAKVDGCTGAPQRTITGNGSVLKDTYPAGKDGVQVVFYTIVAGDHWWPGDTSAAPYVPAADEAVSATDLMWDFFSHHGRSGVAVK